MTENLRLGSASSDTVLTPADSNVTANFTIETTDIETGAHSWAADTKHVYIQSNDTYGNLYNWYTATAGTGTSSMSSTSATELTNATADICPKGWRLPDGGQSEDKSFYMLDKALGYSGNNRTDGTGLSTYTSTPYLFPYSGLYNYDGGLYAQGSHGFWWSRSAYTSAGNAYRFGLDSYGGVYPQNYHNVRYGFSVRCVAK